jgi:dienelactone hydrolase
MSEPKMELAVSQDVRIPTGNVKLEGDLKIPKGATGLVLFAHGSGSSRHSPRNQYVAGVLQEAGIGTLLFDLLTREEEQEDMYTGHLRFNIDFLAERLIDATSWVGSQKETKDLRVGYFGSSTGAAAALVAAAELGEKVAVVVSRGGRPDLAEASLPQVKAASLLIVGARDEPVVVMNWDAYEQLRCDKKVEIVGGATHLFEEPGALEQVAHLAAEWFKHYFALKAKATKAKSTKP